MWEKALAQFDFSDFPDLVEYAGWLDISVENLSREEIYKEMQKVFINCEYKVEVDDNDFFYFNFDGNKFIVNDFGVVDFSINKEEIF